MSGNATEFSIWIPGKPEGQRRGRSVIRGNHASVYKDASDVTYGGKILDAWIRAGRPYLDGPMVVTITARFKRPASHFTTKGELSATGRRKALHTSKPDLDNIIKIVLDALAPAWVDDAYIIGFGDTCKHWCLPDEQPGVHVHARVVRSIGASPARDRVAK